MKQFLLVAVMTIVGFAAGFGGRVWQERHGPLPPPPGTFLGEFGAKGPGPHGPVDRSQLVQTIEKMKPQIQAFNAQMTVIDDKFYKNLASILTPEQKAAAEDRQKKREADHRDHPADTRPLSDDQIARLTQRSFRSLASTVLIPFRMEELNRDYHFSESQEEVVKGLLKTRRDEFLALVDTVPPPTLLLSKLAPEVTRLAAAPAK